MFKSQLTASSLQLGFSCTHFLTYAPEELASERSKKAALEGTAHHDAAESEVVEADSGFVKGVAEFINGSPTPKVDDELIERRFEGWKKQWPFFCPPGALLSEAAFSWNPINDTFGFLGCRIGRNYPENTDLICGTMDVISYHDGVVYVIDHKTGLKQEPCKTNMQMLFGAVCASCLYKNKPVEKVVAELHYIDPDGNITVDKAEYDLFDLFQFKETWKNIFKFQATNSKPNPGDHCMNKYCRAIVACPSPKGTVSALVPVSNLLARITSPEQLQKAHEACAMADRIVKKVKEACKTYCDEMDGEIICGEKKYVRTKQNGSWFNQGKAEKLLGERAQECYVPGTRYSYKFVNTEAKVKISGPKPVKPPKEPKVKAPRKPRKKVVKDV